MLGEDGLVTYPNGAVAPFDPNVALATAQHYSAKAAHGSWIPLEGTANVHPAADSSFLLIYTSVFMIARSMLLIPRFSMKSTPMLLVPRVMLVYLMVFPLLIWSLKL